jgi:large subunit ribosomal protein L9
MDNLGPAGSIVKVKNGYARNYLFARDLAAPVTAGMKKQMEHIRRLAEKKRVVEIKNAKDLRDRFSQLELTVQARAGENERLFGSVTNSDISRALKERGIEIDRRKIFIENPIRVLGNHSIRIRIDPEVSVDLTIKVEPTEESRQRSSVAEFATEADSPAAKAKEEAAETAADADEMASPEETASE